MKSKRASFLAKGDIVITDDKQVLKIGVEPLYFPTFAVVVAADGPGTQPALNLRWDQYVAFERPLSQDIGNEGRVEVELESWNDRAEYIWRVYDSAGELLGVPVHVNVTISLQTLLGLNDEPGLLDRYGPVPAQMAREMAEHGIWRCVAVDDTHGTVLGVGAKTYTAGYVAGKNLRAFLDVAAPVCEIPWCTTRAELCDLEHHTPHAHGGATCSCNVGRTCRRHHRIKTGGDLDVQPLTDPRYPPGTKLRTTPGGQEVVELPYAPLPPDAYRITHPEPEPELPPAEPPADPVTRNPIDDTPPF